MNLGETGAGQVQGVQGRWGPGRGGLQCLPLRSLGEDGAHTSPSQSSSSIISPAIGAPWLKGHLMLKRGARRAGSGNLQDPGVPPLSWSLWSGTTGLLLGVSLLLQVENNPLALPALSWEATPSRPPRANLGFPVPGCIYAAGRSHLGGSTLAHPALSCLGYCSLVQWGGGGLARAPL